jgi:hypothetical protein
MLDALSMQQAAPYLPAARIESEQHWPETSCYADLWIELLHGLGLEPRAMFGFAIEQDYEGDQFTFVKPRPQDIALLYGLSVQELTIYDTLEAHLLEQIGRGRAVLLEVDSYWLPDTAGTSYRTQHAKTTIAVVSLDVAAMRLRYIHNRGRYDLVDADYAGLLAPAALPPFVEFVKPAAPALDAAALRPAAWRILRRNMRAVPKGNPIARYHAEIDRHISALRSRGLGYFHLHAFNLPRQLGANFALLGTHLRWLDADRLGAVAARCDDLAEGAKVLQFHLARCVGRGRAANLAPLLDRLAQSYDDIRDGLRERIDDAASIHIMAALPG